MAGIKPTVTSQATQDGLIRTQYNAWKSHGVQSTCGANVVTFASSYLTVSEGTGYGMLQSLLMAGTLWTLTYRPRHGLADGDTLEEAMTQAKDAITDWIEATIDDGQDIPAQSHMETLRMAHPKFNGWLWALVKIDPAMR